MILQLDMGNSATKWRLDSTRGRLVEGSLLPALETRPAAVWVASVADANREAELASEAKARWGLAPWFARSSAAACGVSNSYAEPERMGVDRWLAMIAAYQRIAGPVCVIDAGSALTIDFVATDGRHRGGYILPGMAMMERSLLGETARVRFGDAPRDRIEPGNSTDSAVLNGLQLAQAGSIALALDRFGNEETLVFTGGNGAGAMRQLGRGGEFVEDLVLDGLNILGRENHDAEVQQA